MMLRRRTLLQMLGAAALTGVPRLRFAGRGMGVGLQLYTVRAAMKQDLEGTLAQVAAIGYREVEFAGYFGHGPAAIRRLLADVGLTAPSSHVEFPTAIEAWDRTLDTAAAVGHQWVTIPWIPAERRKDAAGWRGVAAWFNVLGTRARQRGLRLAFHNHRYEFESVDGQVPFDILLQGTDTGLVDVQLDIYWAVTAGVDPRVLVAKVPGRVTSVHVKDSLGPPDHRMVDPGQGVIDFRRILAAGPAIAHAYVEHDEPADGFETARAGYRYLSAVPH